MVLGVRPWELGQQRDPSHNPWQLEGHLVRLGHGCTIAADERAGVGCLQHELGGNTVKDGQRS